MEHWVLMRASTRMTKDLCRALWERMDFWATSTKDCRKPKTTWFLWHKLSKNQNLSLFDFGTTPRGMMMWFQLTTSSRTIRSKLQPHQQTPQSILYKPRWISRRWQKRFLQILMTLWKTLLRQLSMFWTQMCLSTSTQGLQMAPLGWLWTCPSKLMQPMQLKTSSMRETSSLMLWTLVFRQRATCYLWQQRVWSQLQRMLLS